MRILLVACLAACQPLYGGRSEHLHAPPPGPRPKPVAAEPIAYVDDCRVDFQREPRGVQRKPDAAAKLVTTGNTALTAATTAPPPANGTLYASAIQQYADALRADPYDAEATLDLALAYDRVLHKGCALAMLRRLESLTTSPKLAEKAKREIDELVDNHQWFGGYRPDALAAVNH